MYPQYSFCLGDMIQATKKMVELLTELIPRARAKRGVEKLIALVEKASRELFRNKSEGLEGLF